MTLYKWNGDMDAAYRVVELPSAVVYAVCSLGFIYVLDL